MTVQCIIIGWFGYNNIGDELILHSLLSYLRDEGLNIVVVSANPQQTKRIHDVESIPIDWPALKHLRLAENVIFGGGQIFSDRRMRTIPQWSSILRIIRLLNKDGKIALLNQGFEAKNKILCKMISAALSSTNFISVRDSASFRFIEALNLDIPLFLGPDILFALDLDREVHKSVSTGRSHVTTIGINLRPPFWWHNQSEANRYNHIIASTLDMLIQEMDVELIFIPFRLPGKEHHSDLEFSRVVVSNMKNKDRAGIFACPLDNALFNNLICQFSQLDLFIGTALHSLILACKLEVPFLAFPYQKKCEIFMNDMEFANFIFKPHETSSPNLMFKRISDALDDQKEMKSLLLSKEKSLSQISKKAHIEPLQEMFFT